MTTVQPQGSSHDPSDPRARAPRYGTPSVDHRIDLAAYRAVLDAVGQMTWVNEPAGGVRYFNRTGLAYLGLSNAEVTGRRFLDALHPDDRARVSAVREPAVVAERAYTVEGRFRRHDGVYRWQRFEVHPIHAEDGTLEGWIGSARDIHDDWLREAEREESARLLRERDERLRAALDASHTGTFRWDIATGALEWDTNLDRLFGLPAGATVRSLDGFVATVHPDDRARVVAACGRCARDGADFDEELRVVWPDGTVRWLHDKGRVYRDERGEPAYVTGACIDVTERKRGEEALRAVLESLPQLVWSADPQGNIEYFNQRAEEYTGIPVERLARGMAWAETVHHEDVAEARALWERSLRTGVPYEILYRLRGADGAYRWFVGRAVPARDASGAVARWFGSCTDIHEQVMLREELRRLHDSERDARAEAQRANAAKSAFLAMMSHDLRTPINATMGYVDLLSMGIRGPLTGEQEHDLERIRQSQRMLLALVNEVLEYTRIESGRLEVRRDRLAVADLVAEVADVMRPLAAAKGLALAAPVPPALHALADRDRVRQVLLNLLGNAVKFTASGEVCLTAEARGDRVAFRVRDTGRGIAAERLTTIFDPFVQATPVEAAERDGVGLGLAIARELAQAMEGDVTVESVAGEGSTFTFTVPRDGE